MSIPAKSCRTRSVTDLRAQYGFPVDLPPAHAQAGPGSINGEDGFDSAGVAISRRLVPASAPAAPRGMLGQALGALLSKDAAAGATAQRVSQEADG